MSNTKIVIFFILISYSSLFSWVKEDIYEAASCGNIKKLKQFIKSGIDLNKEDCDNDLPLSLAVSCNSFEATKLLVESGAKINKQNTYNYTAFMSASKLDIIQYLLKNGADIDYKTKRGSTALIVAKKTKNNPKMIELLKDFGAK